VKVLARACMNSSMTSVAFLKERGGLEHMLRSLSTTLLLPRLIPHPRPFRPSSPLPS
jgi:hypothetical protein